MSFSPMARHMRSPSCEEKRHAGIGLVIGDAVEIAEGVLGAHLDPPALDRGQRRGVGHMGVQHDLGARVAGMKTAWMKKAVASTGYLPSTILPAPSAITSRTA